MVVIITVIITDNVAALPTVFLMPFISPAPKRCAVKTVKPAVRPSIKPIIKNMIVPTLPTAARAVVPTNLPTIIVSTIL